MWPALSGVKSKWKEEIKTQTLNLLLHFLQLFVNCFSNGRSEQLGGVEERRNMAFDGLSVFGCASEYQLGEFIVVFADK